MSGAALAAEISRLHERLRPDAAPRERTRNLFAFRSAPRPAPVGTAVAGSVPTRRAATVPAPLPSLTLAGLAEDAGPNGPVRTAVVSGDGQVFLVKEGETLQRFGASPTGWRVSPRTVVELRRRRRRPVAHAVPEVSVHRHHHQPHLRRRALLMQARARAELASAVVDTHGDPAEVFLTERRGHARELAKAAVQRGVRLVMAWGGDGTMNEVACALAFQEVPLGLVPAGSGNGLARELGVSSTPEAGDRRGAWRLNPARWTSGRSTIACSSTSLELALTPTWRRSSTRRPIGVADSVRTSGIAARALVGYVPERYAITTADGRTESRAILVTIANSAQFGNGARIAPGARVDDGLLDLVVVEERSRWRTLWNVRRLFDRHDRPHARVHDSPYRPRDDRIRQTDGVSR